MEILPNLCTAANLLLGVAAIAAVQNKNPLMSVFLIILAAMLDRADGIVARRCNAVTAFGKEFDSLADLVSFGVAPSVLAYSAVAGTWPYPGLACFALFTLCGAYRLARFNVINCSSYFLGVPITVAGAVLAAIIALTSSPAVIVTAVLLLSAAMISTVRIPKI
ncbi:MAG: CDP-diacylglycerol--serine O-phosphatidyltransferase [Firmicutes bacterium]|nr:CDP-diacylglycerol--serine O-phosphatidyltransferase [Bacillota bacterium]